MKRGRRIFYDLADGKILHDTGEASGDVLQHNSISSESAIRYIDIPYGQDADLYPRAAKYHVDTITKTVIFDELVEAGNGTVI